MNHPARRVSLRSTFLLALAVAAFSLPAFAGDLAPSESRSADLSLANFFSVGWDEAWIKRARGNNTPDLSLLRVQTNFLAQLFRTDFTDQENLSSSGVRCNDSLTGTLEYAFNRRFMLALIGNYRWVDSRLGEDLDGGAVAAFARLQLIENSTSSLATTFRAGAPNRDLSERDSTLSLGVSGWQDLAPLGLSRIGLYYYLGEETLAGPGTIGQRRNALSYAVSLAKSWTQPEHFLGNATTFVEGFARTDLDGRDRGETLITITPGVRATIAHHHVLMFGVDFPVTEPRPYERTLRLTYIYSF